MKKLLLSVLVLSIAWGASAQNRLANTINAAQKKLPKEVRDYRAEHQGAQLGNNLFATPNQTVVASGNLRAVETMIGNTWYDLECNYGTPGNRMVAWPDGSVSCVWTMDANGLAGFPDRGTGYNHWDGTAWDPNPTGIIETARKGWPQIANTTTGECVISHTGYFVNSRATKGTGAWTEQDLASTSFLFPRATQGGANGTTVHMLGTPNGPYNGIRTGITYFRSLDGGATWPILDADIPGLDSTNFVDIQVDAYAMDAVGDDIAFVVGGGFTLADLTMFRSADNGTTWTRTVMAPGPMGPLYDALNGISDTNGDGIADTLSYVDSGYDILIDNNGVMHWWGGAMRFLDDDTTGDVSYFPGTDGLLYWNETMAGMPPVMIAEILDLDGDGMITVEADIAIYQCGLSGMPGTGIDASGNLYCAYSSLVENTTNGAATDPQSYRNVYVITSSDDGATWSAPTNHSDSDFDEAVWPVMARDVGANAHIFYMKDGEPGNSFQGTPADPIVNNDIIYNPFPAVTGINEVNSVVADLEVYPNPASDFATLNYTMIESANVMINVTNKLGQTVMTINNSNKAAGEHNEILDIQELSNGIYFVNIYIGDNSVTQKLIVQ